MKQTQTGKGGGRSSYLSHSIQILSCNISINLPQQPLELTALTHRETVDDHYNI
jgi:hypothetical protein